MTKFSIVAVRWIGADFSFSGHNRPLTLDPKTAPYGGLEAASIEEVVQRRTHFVEERIHSCRVGLGSTPVICCSIILAIFTKIFEMIELASRLVGTGGLRWEP